MVCLDSDILINFLRNKREAITIIQELKKTKQQLVTTSINSFELFKGIEDFSKLNESKIIGFLNNFAILDFNLESSKKAAEIFNSLKSQGQIIDFADVMIASIAIVNNQSFLTQNKKHFENIKELSSYDY